MKNILEVTYTKEHTITLDEQEHCTITQAIYNTFIDVLDEFIHDGIDNVPGYILKKIFTNIAEDMANDNEFWGD